MENDACHRDVRAHHVREKKTGELECELRRAYREGRRLQRTKSRSRAECDERAENELARGERRDHT